MTDFRARLIEAADRLEHLHEGSKHIPTDLFQPEDERGIVLSYSADRPVAQFFYGGAAEVFMALGPVALPLLSKLLRKTAAEHFGVPSETDMAALALADHILKAEEKAT